VRGLYACVSKRSNAELSCGFPQESRLLQGATRCSNGGLWRAFCKRAGR
jgi:hypothetical protein